MRSARKNLRCFIDAHLFVRAEIIMGYLRAWFLIGSLMLGGGLAYSATLQAQSKEPVTKMTQELLADLRKGGQTIVFRHSVTPNYLDPSPSYLSDCSAQRNLSTEGRDLAREIGKGFRDLEIPTGIVRASPYCRTLDTARLAFGRVERDDNLWGDPTPNNPTIPFHQRDIRNMAKIPPWPGTNTILVGHGSIAESFGGRFLTEGEAAVVRWNGNGFDILAYLKGDQWKAP